MTSSATAPGLESQGHRRRPKFSTIAVGLSGAAWVAFAALVLRHRLFVTDDSVSNDAHVWYIADRLWHEGRLPWRMPLLGHGKAFAYPYAFVAWTTAALAWPLLGERVVSLWLVLGVSGLIAATFWAFPELRQGWWAVGVLLNPALVDSLNRGQLPFLWAAAPLVVAIGLWRRGRMVPATLVLAVAQLSHAAVILPLAAIVVALWLPFERCRRRLLLAWAAGTVLAVPAVFVVLVSPVVSDSSTRDKVVNLVETVGLRSLVLVVPVVLAVWRHRSVTVRRHATRMVGHAVAGLLLVGFCAGLARFTYGHFTWRAVMRAPDTRLLPYLDSAAFRPGATYRVLRLSDGKVGMYQVLLHGGRLDSEFFPESQARRSFGTEAAYATFLRTRRVDRVLAFASYDRHTHTDEHALLRAMAANGECHGDLRILGGSTGVGFDAYEVRNCEPSPSRRNHST